MEVTEEVAEPEVVVEEAAEVVEEAADVVSEEAAEEVSHDER